MALRNLDNLPDYNYPARCQFHLAQGETDKSDLSYLILTILKALLTIRMSFFILRHNR